MGAHITVHTHVPLPGAELLLTAGTVTGLMNVTSEKCLFENRTEATERNGCVRACVCVCVCVCVCAAGPAVVQKHIVRASCLVGLL